MIKGRDNAAESLADVLELVRSRRQSGLLSAERMQGSRFEEGEIYFQAGQPTYAHTGQLLGQEALLRMRSWRQVYFTFLADQPRPTANIPSAVTVNDSIAGAANIPPAPLSPGPSPFNANRSIPVTPPAPSTSPRLPQTNIKGVPNEGSGRDSGYARNTFDSNTSTPGLEGIVPHKLGDDRNVLSLPLTRPQRSIYMLVDGRRTIADLSRCMRKSMPEVGRLLSELQERGLVSI